MNKNTVCFANTAANRDDIRIVCAYPRAGAIPVRFREPRY